MSVFFYMYLVLSGLEIIYWPVRTLKYSVFHHDSVWILSWDCQKENHYGHGLLHFSSFLDYCVLILRQFVYVFTFKGISFLKTCFAQHVKSLGKKRKWNSEFCLKMSAWIYIEFRKLVSWVMFSRTRCMRYHPESQLAW